MTAKPGLYPPEDLFTHPGHLLRRSLQAMNVLWADEVSRTITSPQFATLNALLGEPNIDQRTLGRRVSLDRSTMAEVVARLSARGLIKGERHAHDARRKTIALTPRGERTVQQLIPRTHRMTSRLVSALDEHERAELMRLLGLVVRSAEARADGKTSRRAPSPRNRRTSADR